MTAGLEVSEEVVGRIKEVCLSGVFLELENSGTPEGNFPALG